MAHHVGNGLRLTGEMGWDEPRIFPPTGKDPGVSFHQLPVHHFLVVVLFVEGVPQHVQVQPTPEAAADHCQEPMELGTEASNHAG